MKKIVFLQLLKYIDRKTLIVSGIIFGLIVIFILFFLYPGIQNMKRLQEKNVAVENRIVRSEKKLDDFPQLIKEKNETVQFLNEYSSHLIKEGDKTQLIGDISDLAKKCNVKIVSIKPISYIGTLPDGFLNYYKPVSYELLLESGYHELGHFINLVEEFNVIVNFESLEIKPSRNSDMSDKIHTIKMQVTTYAKI